MMAVPGTRPGGIATSRAALVILIAVGLVAPLVVVQPFPRHVLIMVLVYAVLGHAWNIIGGLTGQVSLGHAVYFGLGAYTSTKSFILWGLSPWVGMLLGAVVSALVSLAIGYPFFRLRGFYFAIATIALGETARIIFLNLKAFGGAVGLEVPLSKGNPLLNMQFHSSKLPYYYIILAIFIAATLLVARLKRSKIGFYFRTIKESHDAAESLGVDTFKYKVLALAVSAVITSVCGSFYAQYLLYIDPYVVMATGISTKICLVTILGGESTLWGPLIGSALLVFLAEYSRVWLGGGGRGVDLIVYGVLIVLVAAYQPKGIMGLFDRSNRRMSGGVPANESA